MEEKLHDRAHRGRKELWTGRICIGYSSVIYEETRWLFGKTLLKHKFQLTGRQKVLAYQFLSYSVFFKNINLI